jgi:hypothetical protein
MAITSAPKTACRLKGRNPAGAVLPNYASEQIFIND